MKQLRSIKVGGNLFSWSCDLCEAEDCHGEIFMFCSQLPDRLTNRRKTGLPLVALLSAALGYDPCRKLQVNEPLFSVKSYLLAMRWFLQSEYRMMEFLAAGSPACHG